MRSRIAAAAGAAALALSAAAGAAVVPHEGPYEGLTADRRPVRFAYLGGVLRDASFGGRPLFRRARVAGGRFSATGTGGAHLAGRWLSSTRVRGTVSLGGRTVSFVASWAAP